MNHALKEIAQKYEITEEQIAEILVGIGVKNIDNPGKRQLEGLEEVCVLIKEGKSQEEAIAIVVNEAKNGKEEEDEIIDKIATRVADEAINSLPQGSVSRNDAIRYVFQRENSEENCPKVTISSIS